MYGIRVKKNIKAGNKAKKKLKAIEDARVVIAAFSSPSTKKHFSAKLCSQLETLKLEEELKKPKN